MSKKQRCTNTEMTPLHHLNYVASFLDFDGVAAMREVCRHWAATKALWRTANTISQDVPALYALSMCNVGHLHSFFGLNVCASGIRLLAKATNLRILTFIPPATASCDFLASMQSLHVLNMSNADLTNIDLSCLAKLPHLRDVNMSRCKLVPAHFVQLGQATQLESLTFKQPSYAHIQENPFVVADGLCRLVGVKLRSLVLSGCHLPRHAMESIAQIKTLQLLDLKRCERLTDAGLKNLLGLPELQSLDISFLQVHVGVTEHGFAHCASIPTLRDLRLRNSNAFDLRLFFERLAVSKLTRLDVSWCSLDDAFLGNMPQTLQDANFGYNPKDHGRWNRGFSSVRA